MIDFNVMWYKSKSFVSDLLYRSRSLCYDIQLKYNIDDYVMFWIFFGLGVITTLFIQWVF